jgi:hypothetical protein
MSSSDFFEDDTMGQGLSDAEIRAVARRQFVASVAVAVVIACGLGVTLVLPVSRDRVEASMHRFASVQQPTFVGQTPQRSASIKHEVELP